MTVLPKLTPLTLPPSRLNQIAIGKLTALGVLVRLGSDQTTLTGELTFTRGKILHAATRAPIVGAKFAVAGHDQLQFTGPPLAALGPILFYDAPSLAALEERIAAAAHRRMVSLVAAADRLRRLGVHGRIDADRLQVVGAAKAAGDSFELVGGPEGIWARRVTFADATSRELATQSFLVDLALFKTPLDLEIYLTDCLPGLQRNEGPTAAPPDSVPCDAVLRVTPATPSSLTLALLAQKLGPDAAFGLNHPGEVTQNFTVGKLAYRFCATHLTGTTFKWTLSCATGEKWSDNFDLLRFPGVPQLVAGILGVGFQPTGAGAAPKQVGAAPRYLVPAVGEVWVMNVLIEREDQDEVRYACTSVDGKPFGATRVLNASEFREVFLQSGTGWRLLIQMEEIGAEDTVTYRQLDSRRQPRGAPKRIASSILVANFVPEATLY